MKKKMTLRLLSVLMLMMTLVACQPKTEAPKDQENLVETTVQEEVAEKQEGVEAKKTVQVTLEIKVDGEDLMPAKTIDVEEGTVLMDVMKENFEIKETDGFISEIEGQAQDPEANKWWLFDLNDEMAEVGANDLTLKAGDKITWKLAVLE